MSWVMRRRVVFDSGLARCGVNGVVVAVGVAEHSGSMW